MPRLYNKSLQCRQSDREGSITHILRRRAMDQWAYVLGIVLGAAMITAAYAFIIRPWHMTWGSRPEERLRALPGDELVSHPLAQATHAITINAPIDQVWPWLVQVGQGRAGFYSYDWLENLFGCQIRNADQIVPEWQTIGIGDGIKLHPQAPALSVVDAKLKSTVVLAGGSDLQPHMRSDTSFLKLHTYRAFTWAFVIEPEQANCTRLIVRVRVAWDRGLRHFFRSRMFLEPAHSIMQRKMNLGIKHRVEALRDH
jgi:hypothetical protein